MQIDRKHRDPVTARIHGKLLVLGNAIPAIRDQSPGFWRQWDLVPFSTTIPKSERDPLLAQKIIGGELSGVLNWALEGLQRLLARGRFDEVVPPAMRTALAGARLETDSVRAWVHDAGITLSTTAAVEKSAVYAAYSAWCESAGMCRLNSPRFWNRLADALPGFTATRTRTGGGERTRCCNLTLCQGLVEDTSRLRDLFGADWFCRCYLDPIKSAQAAGARAVIQQVLRRLQQFLHSP